MESVKTSTVSNATVPFLVQIICTCTGILAVGTKEPLSANKLTSPENIAGVIASSHNTEGELSVILVGVLSSSSRIPSLSESQSDVSGSKSSSE